MVAWLHIKLVNIGTSRIYHKSVAHTQLTITLYRGSGSGRPSCCRVSTNSPIGLLITHSSKISLPINWVIMKSCTNKSARCWPWWTHKITTTIADQLQSDYNDFYPYVCAWRKWRHNDGSAVTEEDVTYPHSRYSADTPIAATVCNSQARAKL